MTLDPLIDDLQRVADIVDGTPTAADIREHAEYSYYRYCAVFGGLAQAQIAAGLPPTSTRGLPDEVLLEELRAVADELDRTPTTDEFDEHSILQSRSLVSRFDSWNDAIETAGLEIARQTDVTCADVVADVERVAEQLGHTPTRDEMIEHGRYTEHQYSHKCDSFSAAIERADIATDDEHRGE